MFSLNKKKDFLITKQKTSVLRKEVKKSIKVYAGDKNKSQNNFIDVTPKINIFAEELYILYIRSTLRGFHINISNSDGKVLKMFSAGKLGYKKSQRYNQVSLLALVQEVLIFFKEINSNTFKISIILKGFSSKRNRFVKLFINSFLKKRIIAITDLTDLPYNGCRPKKLRRK
jgi:small subunit ribosomal protein S11